MKVEVPEVGHGLDGILIVRAWGVQGHRNGTLPSLQQRLQIV